MENIYLYGSRARGDHRSRSDIDLAIVCPKASQQDWVTVFEIIDDADTLLNIDFVRYDKLDEKSYLKRSIRNDRKILYQKERSHYE